MADDDARARANRPRTPGRPPDEESGTEASWSGQMRTNLPESERELQAEERGIPVHEEDRGDRAEKGDRAAKAEAPYRPEHTGFDEDTTRRAQETAERSRKGAAGPRGAYADETYLEEGPKEAARRMDDTPEDVGDGVERAARAARRERE